MVLISLPPSWTVTRPRSDFRKSTANSGALFVNHAEPRLGIQKNAIVIGPLGEHKEVCALTVAGDDLLFDQSSCQFFLRAVNFINVRQTQTNQIFSLHFDWHRTTSPGAACTKTVSVPNPCRRQIFIGLHKSRGLNFLKNLYNLFLGKLLAHQIRTKNLMFHPRMA
jgi:hypothetical protein